MCLQTDTASLSQRLKRDETTSRRWVGEVLASEGASQRCTVFTRECVLLGPRERPPSEGSAPTSQHLEKLHTSSLLLAFLVILQSCKKQSTKGLYLLACRSRCNKRGRPPEDNRKHTVADVTGKRLAKRIKVHLLTDGRGSPKQKGHVSGQS